MNEPRREKSAVVDVIAGLALFIVGTVAGYAGLFTYSRLLMLIGMVIAPLGACVFLIGTIRLFTGRR